MKKTIRLFLSLSFTLYLCLPILAQKQSARTSDKEISENSGDKKVRGDKTRTADKKMGQSSGDIKIKNYKGPNKAIANNSGDIRVDRSGIRKKDKTMAQSSGDIRVVSQSDQRKQSKKISNYSGENYSIYESRAEGPRNSGSMVLQRDIDHKTMKQIANNEGDIGGNYLEKRTEMRHKKSKEIANYSGDILVKTLNQRARKIRKKNKQIANYKGDIIVTKRKKGMHPSSVYRGGKIKNSYTAKERYRKRMMKRLRRQRDVENPNYMKQKQRKPKHDKREAEIWY